MSKISDVGFRKLAEQFRQNLKDRESQVDIPDETMDEEFSDEDEVVEETRDEQYSESGLPEVEVKPKAVPNADDCYFNEEKIRVTRTRIEFGKFTYVLRYLASTKRSAKKKNKLPCLLWLIAISIGLMVAVYALLTGMYSDDRYAGAALIFALAVFMGVVAYCRSLRTTHLLEFKNHNGETIHTAKSLDKHFIVRLEKAVKKSIAENSIDF